MQEWSRISAPEDGLEISLGLDPYHLSYPWHNTYSEGNEYGEKADAGLTKVFKLSQPVRGMHTDDPRQQPIEFCAECVGKSNIAPLWQQTAEDILYTPICAALCISIRGGGTCFDYHKWSMRPTTPPPDRRTLWALQRAVERSGTVSWSSVCSCSVVRSFSLPSLQVSLKG